MTSKPTRKSRSVFDNLNTKSTTEVLCVLNASGVLKISEFVTKSLVIKHFHKPIKEDLKTTHPQYLTYV